MSMLIDIYSVIKLLGLISLVSKVKNLTGSNPVIPTYSSPLGSHEGSIEIDSDASASYGSSRDGAGYHGWESEFLYYIKQSGRNSQIYREFYSHRLIGNGKPGECYQLPLLPHLGSVIK
ncbi:hypothetical protein Tco_0942948 [Tanacetum coccineum]